MASTGAAIAISGGGQVDLSRRGVQPGRSLAVGATIIAVSLTACEKASSAAPSGSRAASPSGNPLAPSATAAILNSYYLSQCVAPDAKQHAQIPIGFTAVNANQGYTQEGTPEAAALQGWWNTEMKSRPNATNIKISGDQYAVFETMSLTLADGRAAPFSFNIAAGAFSTQVAVVEGCFEPPQATVVDTTIDSANSKLATIIYDLRATWLTGGPTSLPNLGPHSSILVYGNLPKRCTATFRKLDVGGWTFSTTTCL